MNGRGRTHSDPIGGGRAPKNKYLDVVTISNREGERERATEDDDDDDPDRKQKSAEFA